MCIQYLIRPSIKAKIIIYSFEHLNGIARTGHGYRDRLVFAVCLDTRLRPTALHLLKVQQLRLENLRGSECIMLYAVTGGNGNSKTFGGGLRSVRERAAVFPVSEEPLLGGVFNLHRIIHEHLSFNVQMRKTSVRFFL